MAHFKPANQAGWFFTTVASLVTAAGLWLSTASSIWAWLFGQILLSAGFMQWFCLLHECGHEALFRNRRLNRIVGQAAGFFAVIPFACWKRVHALHHHWTGWQDLDPTTETLVSRPQAWAIRLLINACWRYWIPFFSIVYRLSNYWNLARLRRLFVRGDLWPELWCNALVLALLYLALAAWVGPVEYLRLTGLALWLTFGFQDLFLLSQHTHIPQLVSRGEAVRPFSAREQEIFTRSLKFPRWFSWLVLVGSDAHELHHIYPAVPGYRLRGIAYQTGNAVCWWRWMQAARRIPAKVFLFQNRNQTGIQI